jgi:C4-dicarboxylate-specific signal transduction histidine kinase
MQDVGTGIAPESLTSVFDPFVTTQSPGLFARQARQCTNS